METMLKPLHSDTLFFVYHFAIRTADLLATATDEMKLLALEEWRKESAWLTPEMDIKEAREMVLRLYIDPQNGFKG